LLIDIETRDDSLSSRSPQGGTKAGILGKPDHPSGHPLDIALWNEETGDPFQDLIRDTRT